MSNVTLSPPQLDSLVACLRAQIKDHRRAAGRRHSLPTLVAIATAAALAGAKSFEGMADWAAALTQAQTIDKGHGKIVTREISPSAYCGFAVSRGFPPATAIAPIIAITR